MRGHGSLIAAILAVSCAAPAPEQATPTAAAVTPASTAPAAAPSASAAAASASPKALWRPAPAPQNAPPGSSWVAIETFDGRALIASVTPSGRPGPAPVALHLHGDGGLRVRNLDFAAWLASEGFIAVTPCWSSDFVTEDAQAAEEFTPLVGCATTAPRRSSAADVTKDLSAIANAARTLPGARPDRVVVIGHSAGGTAAALAGSMGGAITSVVSISGAYGTGTGPQSFKARWGTNPPEQADGLSVPLLVVHSTSDARALIEPARAYVKLLMDKGKRVETLYVDGASHELPFTSYWTDDVRGKVAAFLKK